MKHFIRVPVGRLTGVYGAHQEAYAAANGTARPLWKKFPDHLLVLADNESGEFESRPYDPAPAAGMSVDMALLFDVSICQGGRRVNPVLNAWIESKSDGKKGTPWSQLGFEIGKSWLESRQETHGFRIISTERSEYSSLEFMRKEQPIRIGVIDFKGLVEITDAEKFKSAMTHGIGHSKAWGCGLVLCARVS